jgi:hypothetical protein
MALPPSEVGALKLAEKNPFPGVREVKVGVPGVVSGVTESEVALELLSPTVAKPAERAVTVKVYD